MELIASLILVAFFVIMNEILMAFFGDENQSSEILMGVSSIVFSFLLFNILSA